MQAAPQPQGNGVMAVVVSLPFNKANRVAAAKSNLSMQKDTIADYG